MSLDDDDKTKSTVASRLRCMEYVQNLAQIRILDPDYDLDWSQQTTKVTQLQRPARRKLYPHARFLPARRYASAGNSDRNVSVRPSVTRRYCVKRKKASGMISSPSGSPKALVF